MNQRVTRILRCIPASPERVREVVLDAADVLRSGELVAFPTETVYGLGADAMNADAVRKVFLAKGRPTDNPLIVHVGEIGQVEELVVSLPEVGRLLANRFWPGPLTLVLNSRGHIPSEVTAGLPTVAVRIPAHSIPREIARELGRGIVGPSANTSGRPSPTTASHVYDDLAGKVDLILDAGATAIGLESTVVDVTGTYPVVLRQGALTLEEIRSAVGGVSVAASAELLLRSPGTRHRHYAPRARVVCTPAGRKDLLDQKVSEFLLESKRVGVLVATVSGPELEGLIVIDVGATPEEYGRKLFAAFRSMDSAGADVIVVEEPPAGRLGATILERLRRAAEPVPGQA